MGTMKIQALLAAALIAASAAASAQEATGQAQAPAFAVGDSWTYAFKDDIESTYNGTRTERVTAVGADGVPTFAGRSQNGKTFARVTDAAGNESVYHGLYFTPRRTLLSFPLFVGKEWDDHYKRGDGQGSEQAEVETHARVVGVESITVPAGTFQAYKIEITGHFTVQNFDVAQKEVEWYAPAAKRWVRYEFYRNPIVNRGVALSQSLTLVKMSLGDNAASAAEGQKTAP
jgi:hypothetical protein